jgi:mannose-1-phosphate guanylyltransferase
MPIKKNKSAEKTKANLLDLRIVILAGGSGTRFWPLSRMRRPKQYLKIIREESLLEETAARVLGLVPHSKIFSIAVADQNRIIRKLLPRIPQKNLLVEPEARNTAPSLLLATAQIYLKNPEAVVVALPADHYIKNVDVFRRKLVRAAKAAFKHKRIVIFGIPPTFPATGYGYIHFSEEKIRLINSERFFEVLEFKEKPDLPTALNFLQSGNHFWNSGMFFWRADVFEQSLKEYVPELFPAWIKILHALKNKDRRELGRAFRDLPALSIDYVLMEKVKGALMSRGDFGWSDLGSWSSLYEFLAEDEHCNVSRGQLVSLDSKNCLVFSPGKLTALIGVDGLIVVNTDDALLVCRRDHDQKVKEIVDELKKKHPDYL